MNLTGIWAYCDVVYLDCVSILLAIHSYISLSHWDNFKDFLQDYVECSWTRFVLLVSSDIWCSSSTEIVWTFWKVMLCLLRNGSTRNGSKCILYFSVCVLFHMFTIVSLMCCGLWNHCTFGVYLRITCPIFYGFLKQNDSMRLF